MGSAGGSGREATYDRSADINVLASLALVSTRSGQAQSLEVPL